MVGMYVLEVSIIPKIINSCLTMLGAAVPK
jgi:hypothetical protein